MKKIKNTDQVIQIPKNKRTCILCKQVFDYQMIEEHSF